MVLALKSLKQGLTGHVTAEVRDIDNEVSVPPDLTRIVCVRFSVRIIGSRVLFLII